MTELSELINQELGDIITESAKRYKIVDIKQTEDGYRELIYYCPHCGQELQKIRFKTISENGGK